jgi:hypothetical protein
MMASPCTQGESRSSQETLRKYSRIYALFWQVSNASQMFSQNVGAAGQTFREIICDCEGKFYSLLWM